MRTADRSLLPPRCRFSGGRLLVYALPQAPASLGDIRSGQALEYEQAFDAAAGSWSVQVALPPGSAVGSVEVWCEACRRAGQRSISGSTASQPLASLSILEQGAGEESTALVLLLSGAAVPQEAQQDPDTRSAARSLQATGSQTLTLNGQALSFDNAVDLRWGSQHVKAALAVLCMLKLIAQSPATCCLPSHPLAAGCCVLGVQLPGWQLLHTNLQPVLQWHNARSPGGCGHLHHRQLPGPGLWAADDWQQNCCGLARFRGRL